VARGYGEDLIRVIRGALQWAENDGPLVAVVRVLPHSLTLPMGSAGALAVSVQDEFGNPLELPLDWRSSDTSVVQVDMVGSPDAGGSGFRQRHRRGQRSSGAGHHRPWCPPSPPLPASTSSMGITNRASRPPSS
jgi:hypothetical protein